MGRLDYQKLTKDLVAAREAAQEAAEGGDGGTCNMDTPVLIIPYARRAKVEAAALAAGLSVSGYDGGRFHVYPPVGAQAAARTRQAEVMCKVLRAAGWTVVVHYQMD